MPITSKTYPFVGYKNAKYEPLVWQKRRFVIFKISCGFTIIELIVTVAVAAILLSIAMPSLRIFVLNARMTTQTNNLLADISLARSEAIKHGSRAVICTSSDGATCTGSGWNSGRLIFWDPSPFNNGPAADRLVRYSEALPGSTVSGVPTTFPDPLIFDSRGAPIDALGRSLATTMAMPILFTLCDASNPQVVGRQASLNVTGQILTNPFAC